MKKTVGEIIKDIRTELNLSQKQFADKLGYSYQLIGFWENGRCVPDIYTVQRMHLLFGIDYNEFFDFYNPKLGK